ncbi:tetratricopeptide repeat protein [Rhizobium sp. Leaf262]|uniref:tetratricopeptide repeat protein n=1 Tax=Rhizobium sp. Leaf262 TaxID=1736312 RepID=UPI0007126006|nr:tetratricopeptide repeat protein [Rhizobium sp. Leaf262]KQO83795.1 hypothetical protein ASF29_03110 [Rhizobium sp. Leaf262]
MPSHLRAIQLTTITSLLIAIAVPSVAVGSDTRQQTQPDGATSMTVLRDLCRHGSAEASPTADANAILEQHKKAREACDKLVDTAGLNGRDLAEALLDRADLAAPETGKAYTQAMADYERAIALVPNLADAYWRRGKANLLYARDLTAALRDLDTAIRLEPSNSQFYVTRASIQSWNGRPELAMSDLNQALSLDPENVHALTNRGLAYSNDGNNSRAIADFDAALKLAPNDSGVYGFRAAARRQAGDEKGAKADDEKMMELWLKGDQ